MASGTSIADMLSLPILRFYDIVKAISAVLDARKSKRSR